MKVRNLIGLRVHALVSLLIFIQTPLVNAGNCLNREDSNFAIVSDIDNTLKITNSSSSWSTIYDGIWGQETFAGMRELFQFVDEKANRTIYLSEAPLYTLDWIKTTLVEMNGFPAGEFQLCNWFSFEGWYGFKKAKLDRMIQHPRLHGKSLLMFGDDVRQDPETYLAFKKENYERQKDYPIYIHRIVNRPLPPGAEENGMIPYYTAFDIALNEMEEGRLSIEQAILVGEAILKAGPVFERVIPNFAVCPLRQKALPNYINPLINLQLSQQVEAQDPQEKHSLTKPEEATFHLNEKLSETIEAVSVYVSSHCLAREHFRNQLLRPR